MTANNSFLSQDQLQARLKQPSPSALTPPFYLKPNSAVFQIRSQRFSFLAPQHQWRSYLLLLAQLSQAQHLVLQQQITSAHQAGLDLTDWSAITANRLLPLYQQLLEYLLADAAPLPTDLIQTLQQADETSLVAMASQYRHQPVLPQQPAQYWTLLLTLASLQVLLTKHALLSEQHYSQQQQTDCCPCCQMPASASIVKTGTDNSLRYLCCQWCNSQWNAVRARCTFCSNTKGISLQRIKQEVEQAPLKAARAEACDACHSYRKLFLLTQDSNAEVIADDIASLALDVLMAENNYQRGGDNIFIPA